MGRRRHQVAVVTGASAGVGRATARHLARRGIAVAVLARGRKGLDAAAEDVRAAGGRPLAIEVDMAQYDQVEAAGQRVEDELGPIDLWINNAFSSVFAPFRETRPEEFRRATEVTYLGYVHGTRVALTHMTPRDRGTIVQVGSALAYRGIPLQATYCGAKHAVVGFTESLRCELRHDRSNVKVTMVHLPALNTPQFDWLLSRLPRHAQPVPPIYDPVVAARAIVVAADRPTRREYWVGAPTVLTILGNRIVPGLLDRYLARTGYRSQQTDQPVAPDQPVNLWHPADGVEGRDYGVRGSFTARSHVHSPQAWLARHRVITTAGLAAAAAGVAVWRRR
ncbi:short-chain dehydrogenase [Micromonospora echinospora]|uniref:Short-chain dehydrogenase n=1 Tax=Micromonospora echinospora TaxID=1877 RepID=A0A1C4YXS7_MICEC|nr:SDR family oxidoreductase [Micromonospora echinospora]OZV76959.1 short-chain dehydrogenase [Micromonospora echinospora]SCF25535.1 Short-chain dehydrogenase [Micromonospora echinospora]